MKHKMNRKSSNIRPHPPLTLDSLDIQIIDELLDNADVTSSAIASKYKVPLSTIQRRRAILESTPMLKHEYNLDPFSFGLREVEFWVMVEKGRTDEVAQHIFEKYKNVLIVTAQMNAISNVGVRAYFDTSEQIYRMIEEVKGMQFVNRVEFAEIIKVVGKRPANFSKNRGMKKSEVKILMRMESKDNEESIQRWFDKEVEDGENSIFIYPDMQTFRQIYTKYVKDQLVSATEQEVEADNINNNNNNNSNRNNKQSKSRIILIAPFYETVDTVKHQFSAFGIENVQRLIDSGSLVIVDAFRFFFPDFNGMKKLIDSLSERARKEGRPGVTAIVDMGSFFLFGGDSKAADLINYEASLAPKMQDSNVKGFSCYHWGNYETLTDEDKEQLTLGRKKKLLEVRERRNYS